MLYSRKYRIYPTQEQSVVLNKHLNGVRYIYNLALETKNTCYYDYGKILSRYDLQEQLKQCKLEFTWLKEINSQSLQSSLMHLDGAFSRYFKELKNGSISKKKEQYITQRLKSGSKINWNKYHEIGKPKFKNKKSSSQSFSIPQNFSILNDKLYIPKLKTGIKIKIHQECSGEHRNATISKTSTGKYFISICIEDNKHAPLLPPPQEKTSIGIDLGIKHFAVLSDGQKIDNPRFLKNSLSRLGILNKRISKKKKNSKNRNKERVRIAKLHEKIVNQRKDFLHKTSTAITKQYDTIIVENLAVKNMTKNHKLAQHINDASWANFNNMLKYKCAKWGKNHIKIDRYFPSSKLHYKCGYVNSELKLSDRTWHCPKCNKTIDRDLNAAINIKYSGLGKPVEPVELPTLVGMKKQEGAIMI